VAIEGREDLFSVEFVSPESGWAVGARGMILHTKDGGDKKSASVRDLEARLARHLGSRVLVNDVGGKGEIAIRYGSLDELDRILDLIMR